MQGGQVRSARPVAPSAADGAVTHVPLPPARSHAAAVDARAEAVDAPDAGDLARLVAAGLARTRAVLDEDLARRVASARGLAPAHEQLWRAVADQVGGRLIRPRLTVVAYLGLGGSDVAAVAPVAAAQELLHTAMLVHDDLLDHDDTRRGRPNVTGSARLRLAAAGVTGRRAEDQVLAAGVLAGDLALAAAFDLVASAPVPADVALRAVRSLASAVDATIAGELLDMTGELAEPAHVDALRVAELKTAVYSCCAPLAAGAVLAGADDRVLAALERYGTALGIAYQLVDDDLGVFGDPAVTGKSTLSDLREGKRTELLRLAYQRADEDQRAVLDAGVGRADLGDDDAARVREVLEATGARAAALRVRDQMVDTARGAVDGPVPGALAQYLCGLADQLGAAA